MQADGREVVEIIEVLLPKWLVEAIAFVDDFHQFAVFLLAHHHARRVARKNRKEKKDHRHHPKGNKERLTDLTEQFSQQSEKIQKFIHIGQIHMRPFTHDFTFSQKQNTRIGLMIFRTTPVFNVVSSIMATGRFH